MKRKENISQIRLGIKPSDSQVDVFKSPAYSNLFYPYALDSADSAFVGLTIDIVNKNSKKHPTFYNEKIISDERNRQSLYGANDIWGFVEASNQNNRERVISNAFCFCGQNISFYIAPQYQDGGYFDEEFVYSQTTLTISVVNLVNGSETILKTFSNFESEKDNTERYFSWDVPSCYSTLFSSHGMFGLYVLKLSISRKFFKDSEFVSPVDNGYPKINQGLLQLLVFSGANEAINVNDVSVTWLDETVLPTDSLEDIFEHSIMANYEDINLPLTVSQKRAIAADQIAFLFIAQHPTITADDYPSQIVGLGANQNIRSKNIAQKIKDFSNGYPDTIRNRLFSILATYKKYNFIDDIESCFEDYSQSLQKLRDPVKTIFIDREGNLKTEYGINGIQLNPYVIDTTESEIPIEIIVERIADLSLNRNEIELKNIAITDSNGEELVPDSRYVKISFSVINGLEEIVRIRYTLWTKNNLNVFEYVDNDPTNNNHTFDCDIFGDVLFRVGDNADNAGTGEILFARIDVENINGMVKSFYAEEFLPSNGIKPGFTKIEIFQRQDGSATVDINYDYFGTSEINNSIINVLLSRDGGQTWQSISSSNLIGDYGVAVMPGRNHILWEPINQDESSESEDLTEFGDYVLIKLTLYDVDGIGNYGKDSNIAVIRFDKPIVAIRKLSREEESEMWFTTTSSSSSSTSSSSSSSSSSTSNSSSSSSSSTSSSSDSSESIGNESSSSSSFSSSSSSSSSS